MADVVRSYISSHDGKLQIALQEDSALEPVKEHPEDRAIVVDPAVKHQPILGLGGTMLDTDVYHLTRMSPAKRLEVLSAICDTKNGANWNLMRVPFGSTDWERDTNFYTYNDMPRGAKDWNLKKFSIQRDIERGLPELLHDIKRINPHVIFLASVWGVPGWMKENDSIMFGRFNPECTQVYARYLCMAVQAWQKLGIEFHAITPQNEPLTSEDRATPACRFTWRMQKEVIKALRREFEQQNIKMQIWCYDHNFNIADGFVGPMLEDGEARALIDGVAFHDYGGTPVVMGEYQAKYPNLAFYMTETHVTTPEGLSHLIDQFHNGSRSYIQWTTMSDEYGGPHQFLGRPFIYPEKPLPKERRNFVYSHRDHPDDWGKGSSWGLYGQFTKFICRGSVRVDSTYGHKKWVTAVAFQDSGGEICVIVVNQTVEEQQFRLRLGRGEVDCKLPANSIGTYLLAPGPLSTTTMALAAKAQEKHFSELPTFDLEVVEVLIARPANAGEEVTLEARIHNVGDAPTPSAGTLYVSFFLDGDYRIGRSVTVPGVIPPGGDIVVAANIPFGKKATWTAESGYHVITAWVEIGNTTRERNMNNNVKSREFCFV